MPSRVRSRIRSDSNSATIANTLNNNRPTGSVGSWTEPPRLSFTFRRVSSSKMSRASGNERANRSSFVTTNVSPAARGHGQPQTRPVPVRAGQAVIDIDPIITHTEGVETITLSGEVLLLRRYARVPPSSCTTTSSCHGRMSTSPGYGGVQDALRYGVPIVATSGDEDKPEVAARVAWSGVGRRLNTETAPVRRPPSVAPSTPCCRTGDIAHRPAHRPPYGGS